MKEKISIFWFRRDLRLNDNHGLYKALKGKFPLLPIFIFDTEILDELPKDDARVTFIFLTLQRMKKELQENGGDLGMYLGKPQEIFDRLSEEFDLQHVIANHDYEPYARKRDNEVAEWLKSKGIGFHTFKDQVIFEKDEIVKDDGDPYVVYTPYSKKWLERWKMDGGWKPYNPQGLWKTLYKTNAPSLTLKEISFEKSNIEVLPYNVSDDVLSNYEGTRNFPSQENGTSHVSPHLRFGTIGYRSLVEKAFKQKNPTFLKELIWREFFMQIIWHFPETAHTAFKPAYDNIQWDNDEDLFNKWKHGKTGYPLVDAGMRELNETGYMHNRVRMVVASFLCKHLLIDWRWGEAYFAEKLLDYDLASNVGNWQWAAGSGVDAAPYFRIFNPTSQLEKFDKKETYVKKWVPEYGTENYPKPIVDHPKAREKCLQVYKAALK